MGSGGYMDLPVQPVKFGDKAPISKPAPPKTPPSPENEEEPDPRDTPPPIFFGEDVVVEGDSLIYVLDASGSMQVGCPGGYVVQKSETGNRMTAWMMMGTNKPYGSPIRGRTWTGASRWQRAQIETIKSISTLPDTFRFNIIVYDCSIRAWKKVTVPASPGNRSAAISWIMLMDPGGGTGTGVAVFQALQDKTVDKILLLTDGGPNCPFAGSLQETFKRHLELILRGNTRGASIDVFGVGAEGALRAWCQSVAGLNHGSYYDVK